jgi:hypothetical protein
MWSVRRDWCMVGEAEERTPRFSRSERAYLAVRDEQRGELRTKEGAFDEELREERSKGGL